ncbi:hypothetical protein [Oceanirhabdus sp. W0125-5]|uniref:hypothetical protein n=1 Tax=Oceanirhabdus sp. W0125-5 TaxID=2999116 RepID=UPI0022F2D244|nr:hypothetical protein [Oceanirhabdus sp. W0125-5]WBW96697.1 hypothetical protein OW730_23835 [Oceanirhabdus sp. W0125-5]
MKFKKVISFLVLSIIVLALVTSIIGIFYSDSNEVFQFKSIHGETIEVYSRGIYKLNSISMVAQGKAQDIVTLVLGIPLLLISLYLSRKGSLKGRVLLTGTLGYFLYTYISYVFLWMYNPLFLVYVILMSASFFSFILTMMSFDIGNLELHFNKKLPVKFIGGFQIFFGSALGMLWLGRTIPALINGTVPEGLEHYTTLVIQGLDLGFIVPVAVVSGVLIIKRKPMGYLLSSVIIVKGFTMGIAIIAMIIAMIYAGVKVSFVESAIFPIITLIIIYCLVLILKNINEK